MNYKNAYVTTGMTENTNATNKFFEDFDKASVKIFTDAMAANISSLSSLDEEEVMVYNDFIALLNTTKKYEIEKSRISDERFEAMAKEFDALGRRIGYMESKIDQLLRKLDKLDK